MDTNAWPLFDNTGSPIQDILSQTKTFLQLVFTRGLLWHDMPAVKFLNSFKRFNVFER